jgi:hypothetical protein
MKKCFSLLLMLQILVSSLGIAQNFPEVKEVLYRPWQMHRGQGPIDLASRGIDLKSTHGNPVAYQLAEIPAFDKPDGWVEAPMDATGKVTFSEASTIPCYQQVDFTYFKTTVFIPANLPADKKVKSLSVTIGSVDDGARMIIYNKDNFIGYYNPANDGKLMGKDFTTNFSDRLAEGFNTIVIIQMDDCRIFNNLTGGLTVKVNGSVLPPADRNHWCNTFGPDYCKQSPSFSENPGNIKIEGDELILTSDSPRQKGASWSKSKIDLNKDFEITTEINFGSKDAEGADGVALVFQNKSTHELSDGEGIGYKGINPSYAIEFDTYQNGNLNDPPKDHVGLRVNGDPTHNQAKNDYKEVDNLEDGKYHPIIFSYRTQTKTFSLTLDGKAIFTNQAFPSSSFSDGKVYYGFTAATGGSSNKQSIRKVSYKQK